MNIIPLMKVAIIWVDNMFESKLKPNRIKYKVYATLFNRYSPKSRMRLIADIISIASVAPSKNGVPDWLIVDAWNITNKAYSEPITVNMALTIQMNFKPSGGVSLVLEYPVFVGTDIHLT